MNKPLYLIKFGGSVISIKDQMPPQVNTDMVQKLVAELVEVHKKARIILVHGGGSFSHQYSHDYQLPDGIKGEYQVQGMSITNNSSFNLHHAIVQEMINQNLPAMGLPPQAFIRKRKKEITTIETSLVEQYLQLGFIPVMYGNVILDEIQGCAIISGDEIMSYFGKKLGAKKVVFVSDVDGIFTDNPKINPDAKQIPVVNDDNFEEVLTYLKPHNPKDVTGEMEGKLKNIKQTLSGHEVYIINGFKKNSLSQLLVENKALGTKILLG